MGKGKRKDNKDEQRERKMYKGQYEGNREKVGGGLHIYGEKEKATDIRDGKGNEKMAREEKRVRTKCKGQSEGNREEMGRRLQ